MGQAVESYSPVVFCTKAGGRLNKCCGIFLPIIIKFNVISQIRMMKTTLMIDGEIVTFND